MSRFKNSVMLLFLMNVSNSLYSQEDVDIDQSALDIIAENYCSVSADIYKRCFNLDESQCRQVFLGIIETCRQNDDGFPIQDDAEAISAFKSCTVSAFLSHLESTGIDLEASCE
jgi:hypothetical protein